MDDDRTPQHSGSQHSGSQHSGSEHPQPRRRRTAGTGRHRGPAPARDARRWAWPSLALLGGVAGGGLSGGLLAGRPGHDAGARR